MLLLAASEAGWLRAARAPSRRTLPPPLALPPQDLEQAAAFSAEGLGKPQLSSSTPPQVGSLHSSLGSKPHDSGGSGSGGLRPAPSATPDLLSDWSIAPTGLQAPPGRQLVCLL